MSLMASLRQRDCPVCGVSASAATPFLERSLDEKRLSKDSFSSRKVPEFMSYRLVRCRTCATVFASEAPGASALADAYHGADYASAEEADFAARVYREALVPFISQMPTRGVALEIGTGTGIFLHHLRQLGFERVVGIEPSPAAIAAAAADIKSCIREGVFTGDELPDGSVSLICCFQTLEHVPEPGRFVEAAFRMLEPGGMVALITHDYTAPINRLLGRRSPIIDIEHLQLFCAQSLRRLVSAAGFAVNGIRPIRNTYPLRYWMSLLPVPVALKRAVLAVMQALHVADRPVSANVGNLLTVGQKPR